MIVYVIQMSSLGNLKLALPSTHSLRVVAAGGLFENHTYTSFTVSHRSNIYLAAEAAHRGSLYASPATNECRLVITMSS